MEIKSILMHLPVEKLKSIETEVKNIIKYKQSCIVGPPENYDTDDLRNSLLLPKLTGICQSATRKYFINKKDIRNPIVNDLSGVSLSEMSEIWGFGLDSQRQVREIAKKANVKLLP